MESSSSNFYWIFFLVAILEVLVVLPIVAPRAAPNTKPILIVGILLQSALLAGLGVAAKMGYIFK